MCDRCLLFPPAREQGMLCSGCAADLRLQLGRDVPYANLEAYWCAHRQDLNELRVVDLRADRVTPVPGPAPLG